MEKAETSKQYHLAKWPGLIWYDCDSAPIWWHKQSDAGRREDRQKPQRCWKSYRKTQYK